MINFYQRNDITRSTIIDGSLKKWKLGFWFCILDNNVFKPVSPVFYTNEVEDSKMRML